MNKLNYLAVILIAFPFISFADNSEQDFSELGFDELMQVEVTSVSKKSEKLSEAAAAVYVVSAEDIRRTGATSIPEALRLVPGVDAVQIDPNRWAVSIRGFNGRFANKLLVLIDGRSVYTPVFSGVYWEYLDYLMDDISRIEVIRGPGATLWGSNAVNGVINIITREAGENPGGALSVAAGNEYQGASIRQGGEISENVQMRAYAKAKRIDESQDLDGNDQDNGGDYLQTGFRIDIQPKENQWATVQGDLYKTDYGQQLSVPDLDTYTNVTVQDDVAADGGNLGLSWGKLTGLDSELSVRLGYDFYNHDEILYEDKGDQLDIEVQHQFVPYKNNNLVWGIGYKRSGSDLTSSSNVGLSDESSTNKIWNLFIQNTTQFTEKNIALTLGAKLENNNYSDDDAELQPNIRASWIPSEDFTGWAAISRATRSPSRADIEGEVNIGIIDNLLIKVLGNEDFESEQLDAYEMGVRWKALSKLTFDLATFYNKYEDLRSSVEGDRTIAGYYNFYPTYLIQLVELENNIEGYSTGGELLATWQATRSSRFRFVYNYLDIHVEDSTGADESSVALIEGRALEHQVSLWGSFNLTEKVELDVRVYYNSERSWEDEYIDDIVDADLRLGWQVTPSFDLSLVGQNLFNSAEQEFISESWSSPSALERSVFVKGKFTW